MTWTTNLSWTVYHHPHPASTASENLPWSTFTLDLSGTVLNTHPPHSTQKGTKLWLLMLSRTIGRGGGNAFVPLLFYHVGTLSPQRKELGHMNCNASTKAPCQKFIDWSVNNF